MSQFRPPSAPEIFAYSQIGSAALVSLEAAHIRPPTEAHASETRTEGGASVNWGASLHPSTKLPLSKRDFPAIGRSHVARCLFSEPVNFKSLRRPRQWSFRTAASLLRAAMLKAAIDINYLPLTISGGASFWRMAQRSKRSIRSIIRRHESKGHSSGMP
jgi:hypothetical protein